MKKVTMFVWNHFTNDARVMREGMALSENNYDVNLIAIENRKDPRAQAFESINDRFRVHRVPMYPWLLEVYQNNKKEFVISVAGVTIVVAPALFYKSWLLMSTYFLFLGIAYGVVKNSSARRNMIKLVRSMKMIIKGYRQNADIYHSNDLNTLTQGVICSKLRLKPKKLVYDSHEVQTDRTGYNPKIIERWEGSLLPFVDETLVENHTRAKKHEALYGYYPHTLYNYSELYDIEDKPKKDLHEVLGLSADEKILLYQGGLQPGRGLELLVDMMPMVNEGTLVFLGDGRQKKELEEMVKERGLQERVRFVPKVHLSELPSYTQNAYLGFQVLQNVNYNHYSASSNKLFEYIMAHVPVISCNFPEIASVVEGENVGIAINAESAENIASAVNRLVEDETLRETFSNNCKSAKYKYNWDIEKEKLLDVYDKLSQE
ncbi:glycosyltransferase [Salinicoccus roseus]|uniref:Glycosyl transferase n=1 Tax=Salinicoccus roseus TaxID=45670 RepID=A0A0C2HIH4_9STAP|nr:glycosyltransferase [Salinicoccus roseus]KIH71459.1 glycosyl transferase [Salinicoccus roseus]MDB0579525.1 glycosyltransferase [Salinicoccus roseus]